MKFDEYSEQAITTDTFGGGSQSIESRAFLEKLLGLAGEAGEVADKVKKILRDKDGQLDDRDAVEITKEMGDVLWYLNALSIYLGSSLEDVAQYNLQKVLSRKARNKISGSGDNR